MRELSPVSLVSDESVPDASFVPQRALVIAAAHGDEDAFARLVATWTDRLFAFAYRLEHDWHAANDAVQDALVAAWRDLPGLRDPDRFEPWLYRILIRTCARSGIDRRRRHRTSQIRDLSAAVTQDPADEIVDRDALRRAFAGLSLEHRVVIVLRHGMDRPIREVAEILGLPEGTVASRLHYALQAMRAAIDAGARTEGPR